MCTRHGDGASYRLIHQTLATRALTPGTALRLTAGMRGEEVQKGDVEWKTACPRWCVQTEGAYELSDGQFAGGEQRGASTV